MTDTCPVCLAAAQREERDYGDKKQIICPRCGPFEVSRTALAMLSRRIDQDPLARARLSHAIRSRTSEDNWFFVSSGNIDELAQQELPGIQQQLQYLALWLAAKLGDDQFGRIPCPLTETLAGMIGTVDGERVTRLIDYAVREGIVERDIKKEVLGLSPKGWVMIQQTKTEEPIRKAAPIKAASEVIKAHCNICGGDRNAYQRATYSLNGSDGEISWADTFDVLECCGCNNLSVQRSYWFSEWDQLDQDPLTGQPRLIPGIKVTNWPPTTNRKKPDWVDNLHDDVLRCVLDEVYEALNSGLIVLASIGTRTLIDRAMFLRIGDPTGGFAGKLNLMVDRGHIGMDEREILEAVTDAGSAAAHRGFVPRAEHLVTIVETTENFLHREFILKTAAGEVRTATPSRHSARSKGPS